MPPAPLGAGRFALREFRGRDRPPEHDNEHRIARAEESSPQKLKRAFAHGLRKDATDTERKLWSYLRQKQVHGLRFRRQQPIGPYVADFYCSVAKLIVELGQHGEAGRRAYDEARTKWLESEGFQVLRIASHEFLRDPELTLDWIWYAIETNGCALPPRHGGWSRFSCGKIGPPPRAGRLSSKRP